MKKGSESSLHLRFNPANIRHAEISAFISSVKPKYKTALIVAALEAYREQHPYGVDYRELEPIRKQSWQGFLPKVSIQKIVQERRASPSFSPPAVKVVEPKPEMTANEQAVKAIDRAIDLYELDDE